VDALYVLSPTCLAALLQPAIWLARATSTVLPPTSTVPLPAPVSNASSGVSQWVIALVSAVVGGALTIAGDIILRSWSDRTAYLDLRRSLNEELSIIFAESEARAQRGSLELHVEAPLPLGVWHAMLLSGHARRLGAMSLTLLSKFYRTVEATNQQAAQVPLLLQTSTLSDKQEAQVAFRREAERLSSEPFAEVARHRKDIMALFDDKPHTSRRPAGMVP
jgi:hypothetical protein